MKFTGYKYSDNYENLINAIKKTTDVKLSKSTLRNLFTFKHNGSFQNKTFEAINKFIVTYTDSSELFRVANQIEPVKQRVFWCVIDGVTPGMYINSYEGQFIEWAKVKIELEKNVIIRCPQIIPPGSSVTTGDFYGKKHYVLWILNKNNETIGSVWLGTDPYNGWNMDGYVRIGKTIDDNSWKVWQIMQRYSDGSYRMIKSFM